MHVHKCKHNKKSIILIKQLESITPINFCDLDSLNTNSSIIFSYTVYIWSRRDCLFINVGTFFIHWIFIITWFERNINFVLFSEALLFDIDQFPIVFTNRLDIFIIGWFDDRIIRITVHLSAESNQGWSLWFMFLLTTP